MLHLDIILQALYLLLSHFRVHVAHKLLKIRLSAYGVTCKQWAILKVTVFCRPPRPLLVLARPGSVCTRDCPFGDFENFQNYRIPYAVPHTGCGHRIPHAVTAYCMRRRISDAAAAYSMRRHILESELTGSISSAGSFRQFLGGAAPQKTPLWNRKAASHLKSFCKAPKRTGGKASVARAARNKSVVCCVWLHIPGLEVKLKDVKMRPG